jgi:hypothetical protein
MLPVYSVHLGRQFANLAGIYPPASLLGALNYGSSRAFFVSFLSLCKDNSDGIKRLV